MGEIEDTPQQQQQQQPQHSVSKEPPALSTPPPGQVSLADKTAPVEEQSARGTLRAAAAPYVFSRGAAGAAPLAALLSKLGDAAWDEAAHARDNVRITRPAHDRWGVRKAVLVYCDDFLKGVYGFPWWREERWRAAVAPVLRVLGVPRERVVRCLLASMPPGCDIPVHHDTGYWVKHTHRIHMAVHTCPGKVRFRVGPTADAMRDVAFAEGEVIELNNQAKHAVRNDWDRHRVHLILDYVEDHPVRALQLPPGARLAQTRRSIDLLSAAEGAAAAAAAQGGATAGGGATGPAFIVIGAQKCGTTSMYEYLNQHPLVLRSRRRETHFFDWRWQPQLKTEAEQQAFYLKFFHGETLALHPSIVTGESTPSYLLHFDVVIPRLQAVAPHAKLIVMLRDPVKRAYSHYQMTVDDSGTAAQKASRGCSAWAGKTFEQAVAAELQQLSAASVTPATTPEEFSCAFLPSCPMGHGGHSMLARGLYALQLRPWLAACGDGIKVRAMFNWRPHQYQKVAATSDQTPPSPFPPPAQEAANTRSYAPMGEAIRQQLTDFYAPYNAQLAELLGRALPWQ
ncbi:Sulfotransferase [Tribonema minus]|uniref:Sulfotransferase n=1 Tax=Tribonema minus TaxID=303371 RepID=A0A835YZ41_9STRA|nr:Sulfotransferase [Tribonema minus]